MKFAVTIKRTITTVVEVEATSRADARHVVDTYGVIEAISDLPMIEETVDARISKVTERE